MRPATFRTTFWLLLAATALACGQAHALWQSNGLALSPEVFVSGRTGVASDSAGGMFVAWITRPTLEGQRTYALRVLGNGTVAPGWSPNGNLVATEEYGNVGLTLPMVPDGLGGALIPCSIGFHGPHFAASRVTASGIVPSGWPKFLCTDCTSGPVVDGGSGSALNAWISFAQPPDNAIHLSRIPLAGSAFNGSILPVMEVSTPLVASNGAGGAFVFGLCSVWLVNSSFATLWEEPLPNCDSDVWPNHAIVSDGAGGAFLAWWAESDIRVLRVGPDGFLSGWNSQGVIAGPHATPTPPSAQIVIALDGSGGVFVGWAEDGSPGYLQRVSGSGQIVAGWPVTGRVLRPGAEIGSLSTPVADRASGAYVGWDEERGVYAQHLTASGSVAPGWVEGGAPIGSIARAPVHAATDGTGGVFFVWIDRRDGLDRVYGQHVSEGEAPVLPVDVASSTSGALRIDGAMPNPARDHVECSLRLPKPGTAKLELFDTSGRRVAVRVLVSLGAGRNLARIDQLERLKAGVYHLRLTQAGAIASTKVVLTR